MTPRLGALQGRLRQLGLGAILFNTSEITRSLNLTYLSGFTGSDASALITRTELHLFTDGRYKTQAKLEAPDFQIHVIRAKIDALARALASGRVTRLGVEGTRISFEFVQALLRKAPDVTIVPLKRSFLETFRIRKSPEEKELIRKAAAIASQACKEVIDGGLVGKREDAIAADLENRFRRLGAEGIAFETIVASGPRSAMPHGTSTEKIIERGELVILDFGCRWKGYHSDETVTCITGKPSSDQKKIFQAVYAAHNKTLESLTDGMEAKEADAISRRIIEKAGFGKYFLHSLGHGVGLEIHEPPVLSSRSSNVLTEGMVFTVEPGIYIEGIGGVRLESLVYLGSNGPEILSHMSKELISAA
jgi:Xaa-Pro aminopeptidase